MPPRLHSREFRGSLANASTVYFAVGKMADVPGYQLRRALQPGEVSPAACLLRQNAAVEPYECVGRRPVDVFASAVGIHSYRGHILPDRAGQVLRVLELVSPAGNAVTGHPERAVSRILNAGHRPGGTVILALHRDRAESGCAMAVGYCVSEGVRIGGCRGRHVEY